LIARKPYTVGRRTLINQQDHPLLLDANGLPEILLKAIVDGVTLHIRPACEVSDLEMDLEKEQHEAKHQILKEKGDSTNFGVNLGKWGVEQ
jgi:hypothetical protein